MSACSLRLRRSSGNRPTFRLRGDDTKQSVDKNLMQLDIHPSRYLLALILLVHIAASLCVLALPLQWWAMLLIDICLLGSFIYNYQKYVARRNKQTIVKVWIDEKQTWQALLRGGEVLTVKLLGDSISSKMLVILNFQVMAGPQKNKKYSVIIFPDSVTKISFRRLKAWLNSHR